MPERRSEHPAAAPAPWTCPSCAVVVATPYCSGCGERPVLPRDVTLRGLLHQLFQAISSIDGRLLRSLRALVTRPGALTVAWVRGPRKPYLGPIQLFFLANVTFVAAQSLTGTNVFSSTLESHLHRQDWSPVAQRMVDARLASKPTTLKDYEPVFDRAVAFNAKSLVIVMTLPFVVLLPVLFVRDRRPFAVHMVFSLHVYSFLLILYTAALAVSAVDLMRGGIGLDSPRIDTILTLFNLAASAAYLYVAIGAVYDARGATRVVGSLTLAVAILAIAQAYRFGLLVLTLRVV